VVVTGYPPRCRLKTGHHEVRGSKNTSFEPWMPLLCTIPGLTVIIQKPTTEKTPGINSVKLFPNPVIAGNSINALLRLEERGQYHVELIDAAGRVVWMKKLNIDATPYNLAIPTQSTMSRGLYFLRISGKRSQKIYTGKLTIQ
jgi:hypothetical protein